MFQGIKNRFRKAWGNPVEHGEQAAILHQAVQQQEPAVNHEPVLPAEPIKPVRFTQSEVRNILGYGRIMSVLGRASDCYEAAAQYTANNQRKKHA